MLEASNIAMDPGAITRPAGTDTLRFMLQGGRLLSSLPKEASKEAPEDIAQQATEDAAELLTETAGEMQEGISVRSEADPLGVTAYQTGTLGVSVNPEAPRILLESEMPIPGGYRVQYTDEAQQQMESLELKLCGDIDGYMQAVAAISPRNRSTQVGALADLRSVERSGYVATFWVSEPFPMERILTVVDVSPQEVYEDELPPESGARFLGEAGLGRVHFIDDVDEAYPVQPLMAS